MTEIEIVTILISSIALLISILGYLDNRKKLKIVFEKENERRDIKRAIESLRVVSDELKELPQYIYFGRGGFMFDEILQEVYEKEKLDLVIQYKNLKTDRFGGKEYAIESINADLLRSLVKEFSSSVYCAGSCILDYNAYPNVITNEFLELSDFFSGLASIEKNLNKLKEHEDIIDPFDNEIIKIIDNNIQETLEILSDALKIKAYNLKFDRDMKPSDIENKIYEITNYALIRKKVEYLSKDVALKVDGLRSKLFELVLTK